MKTGPLAALLLAVLCSCARSESGKPQVVTTCLPLYCLAANVAGNLARVENLLPPGATPHDFQLAPRDVRRLGNARIIVSTGLGLEEWLSRTLQSVSRTAKIVSAAEGLGDRLIPIAPSDKHHHGHDHGEWNPHFWLDPTLAAHAVTNIMRALQEADPSNAGAYSSNALTYINRLHKLDREIDTGLTPYKNTPIVTYHDAFPYFARRYQLDIIGIIEPSTDVEPSPRHLSDLRKRMRERNVRVVFTEKDGASKVAERIAGDLGVKVAVLDPLESGELTPEAYEKGMRRNLAALTRTLDAAVP